MLVFILAFTPVYSLAEEIPDNWEPVVEMEPGFTMYIDTGRIKTTGRGTISAWIKAVKPEGFYDHRLYEFDCPERLYKIISLTLFKSEGNIIDAEMALNPDWIDINPGSFMDVISKAVCRE
jgi:hypothetical protein